MSDVIYLKTGQFSNRSFNASKKELKKAADALNILDDHGAMSNTTYTCDGISRPIFSEATIVDAAAVATLVNHLYDKLEAYSSLLQSGPDALHDADSSFKGEYTNAWQRGWHSISSGVSSVYNNTVSFWGSLFRKDGKKTGGKTKVRDDSRAENESVVDTTRSNNGSANPSRHISEETVESIKNEHQWQRVGVSEEELNAEIDRIKEDISLRYGTTKDTVAEEEIEIRDRLSELYYEKVKARYISQTDPKAEYWGAYYDSYYGDIKNYGCFTSSISMAFGANGVDILPSEVCDINLQNPYNHTDPMLTYYGKVAEDLGYRISSPSDIRSAVSNYLENSSTITPPIIEIQGSGGEHHYVVVMGINDVGDYIVRNPAGAGDYSTIPGNTYVYASYQFSK